MSELVFLESSKMDAEPFTTSEVIAEFAGVQHHTITRLIRDHKQDFEEFGKVGFEIEPLPDSKTGQSIKIYHLNKEHRGFGVIAFEMRKPSAGSKGGRPETIYHLNEEQVRFEIDAVKQDGCRAVHYIGSYLSLE